MITEQEIRRQIDHLNGELNQPFVVLLEQCNEYELCDRRNFAGHITVSAIIVHIRSREVLLLHHKTFDRWMLPGGHMDWEEKSIVAALQHEVSKKTGLQSEQLLPLNRDKGVQYCISINSQTIPANKTKDEPSHYHFDFRFIFGYTGDKDIDIDRDMTTDYQWVSVDNLGELDILDPESIDQTVLNGVTAHEQTIREKHDNDYLTTPIAWYQFHLARSYVEQDQIGQAEQMYRQCIDSFEKTYDEEYETPTTILPALWNLSLIYQETNQYNLSLKTLEKGLTFAQMYAEWDENYSDWVTELTNALNAAQQGKECK